MLLAVATERSCKGEGAVVMNLREGLALGLDEGAEKRATLPSSLSLLQQARCWPLTLTAWVSTHQSGALVLILGSFTPFLRDVSVYLYLYICKRVCVSVCVGGTECFLNPRAHVPLCLLHLCNINEQKKYGFHDTNRLFDYYVFYLQLYLFITI